MPNKELTTPPIHDQVVNALVANTVADIRAGFERSTDEYSANDRKAVLGTLLSITQIDNIGISLGSGKTTFAEMHNILAPLASEKTKLPYSYGGRFRQFVDDLEILSIFEQESIDGINQRLDQTLQQLQKGKLDHEQQREVAYQANRLLYRAIYLFPHLVNSLEVQLDPKAADEAVTEKLWWEYYEPNRYDYQKLHEERVKRDDTEPDTLVIPLPYGFSTGTHGSGERAAMGQSRREIYFGFESKKGQLRDQDAALMVTVEYPLITSHETMFLPKEVRSIRLSQRGDFTPFFDDRHKDGPLIDKGHHIGYYLMFRHFSNYGSGRYFEGEQRPVILEPFKNTWNLWSREFRHSKEFLRKGFFVVYTDQPEETVMYEVNDYQLSGLTSDEKITAAMEQDILNRDRSGTKKFSLITTDRSSYMKYFGNQIVDRLARIPVLPRDF